MTQLSVHQKLITTLFIILITTSTCKLTLLTSTYQPFVDCGNAANPDSSSIYGAEIQLIRAAFITLNWTEGSDFVFECLPDFNSLTDAFLEGDNTNVAVVGGFTMTSERLIENYKFSQPTVTSALSLVYQKTSKGWFFRRGLDIMGWILIIITTITVGGLMYFLESRRSAYINMLYNAFCQFFLTPDYPLTNFPSKLVHFFSTFLVLIVVIVFTAASTNILQSDHTIASRLSLENISGRKIYTNEVFRPYLEQPGIQIISIDAYDSAQLASLIETLGDDYLLVDGPYSDYLVLQHCDLYTGLTPIMAVHYGIMFHSQFSDSP